MFKVDYKKLTLSFNQFHVLSDKDMPQYGEYCLVELKTGDYTAGGWHPSGNGRNTEGYFLRGTADTVDSKDVVRWHSLTRYDLTECLEDEEIDWINSVNKSKYASIDSLAIEIFCWKTLI